MIYAIRYMNGRHTLMEFDSQAAVSRYTAVVPTATGVVMRHVDTATARKWVIDGKEHETGLFINDDGSVEYAPAEGE
jgi:hypothetical protein